MKEQDEITIQSRDTPFVIGFGEKSSEFEAAARLLYKLDGIEPPSCLPTVKEIVGDIKVSVITGVN